MPVNSLYMGFIPQAGRWNSGVKLGGVHTLPVEFVIDENLPPLGQDLNIPNRDWVVISRGRIVAARPTDLTRLFPQTVVTLATGVSPLIQNLSSYSWLSSAANIPIGYAPFHFYRDFAGLPADKPVPVKHETIEVPYTTVNEAYNTSYNGGTRLMVGEWVMPYFGSNNSKTQTANFRGRHVRWVEQRLYQTTVATASAIVILDKAEFPAFFPNVVMAWGPTGAVITTGWVSADYNQTYSKWQIEFGQPVSTVLYSFGASEQMRVGQIIGIEPVGDAGGLNATSHDLTGWLKWVTDQFGAWDWPPIMSVRPTTQSVNEAVTVDGNNQYQMAFFPVVPFKSITVVLTGTITDENGVTTSYSGKTMDLSDQVFFNDYTQGKYYNIDFLTGKLTFTSNVVVTAATVSYWYESQFRDGLKYDRGILNLTDGRDSGIVGLPTHLDVAGVRGALRISHML